MDVILNLRHDQEEVEQARRRLTAEGRSLEAEVDAMLDSALREAEPNEGAASAARFFAERDRILAGRKFDLTDEEIEEIKYQHIMRKYGI